MGRKATVLGVGDIIVSIDHGEKYFDRVRDTLKAGDIAIGNLEEPYTNRPSWSNVEPHSAPPGKLENLNALVDSGIDVITIGGNHCFDQGAYGILDPMDFLHEHGIATCGAGKDIYEARTPAVLERNGMKFAFLHYNLTGPRECYAAILKTGCAFINIATAYCNDRAEPGGSPTRIYTIPDPKNKQDMVDDIFRAKEIADHVIVYFHSGRPGDPQLLQYEIDLTHHCIDIGVEMVLCTHTHALSSVEVYRGKPIFYGLGNFVTLTTGHDPNAPNAKMRHTDPYEWPGIQPYWPYDIFKEIKPGNIPNYAFADYSRNTLIAKAEFDETGLVSAGFIPCWINEQAQPEPVTRDGKGADVVRYLADWTSRAGLKTAFNWNAEGTEIVFDLN